MDCLGKVVEVVRAQVAEGVALVGFRPAFEKVFKKRDIDFQFAPGGGYFVIAAEKRLIVVASKKVVEVGEEDIEVGPYAVGYIG